MMCGVYSADVKKTLDALYLATLRQTLKKPPVISDLHNQVISLQKLGCHTGLESYAALSPSCISNSTLHAPCVLFLITGGIN